MHLPSLAFARALLRAASRTRHRRRLELAGAPLGSPPLLEFECRGSLHLHPLDTPVHAHWPVDLPALRHCSRRSRPPPPSPPTVAGAVFRLTNPANRLRVSPNPTLAAYSPEPGRPSPLAGLAPPPGTSLRGLKSSQGSAYKNQGPNCKKNRKPRFKILNLVNYVVNGRKIGKMQTQLFWNPCEEY
jgi:hypothetical protein